MNRPLVRRYVPDLAALLRCCELNYVRLHQLLRPLEQAGQRLCWALDGETSVEVVVDETTRYTALISLRQQRAGTPDWLLPAMRVRMYHDARLAEVLTSQQISSLAPRYDYPNAKMHQRDEKYRVNHFLGEWLAVSRRIGYCHSAE